MTNIYNKRIIYPNGTLVDNWYEEDELRKQTGEGRAFPGNGRKGSLDKNNTFKRVMGEKEPQNSYLTFNKVYGDFKYPELKYLHPTLRQKEINAKFKAFVQSSVDLKKEIEEKNDSLRIYNSTYRSVHVPQPFEAPPGRRHMKSQDGNPIPPERPDKLFMAQHKMSKYPQTITETEVNSYIDKYIPYYKDKEITYWSMNLDKGNMYRSFTLGTNPFAKSHAFTQPIQKTRGTIQYYGNNKNLKSSKNIYFDPIDVNYYENYKKEVEGCLDERTQEIQKKLIDSCSKKGWIGLRALKIYLRILKKNSTEEREKAEFKFYTAKCGFVLTDEENSFIFKKFDVKKNNTINFIEVLNSFRNCNDERKKQIESFKNQVLKPGQKFISFSYLEKIIDTNYHPEVMKFIKTAPDVLEEYVKTWDNLKDDDLISEKNFEEYFYDISTCIETDEDFLQCLKACGYQ